MVLMVKLFLFFCVGVFFLLGMASVLNLPLPTTWLGWLIVAFFAVVPPIFIARMWFFGKSSGEE